MVTLTPSLKEKLRQRIIRLNANFSADAFHSMVEYLNRQSLHLVFIELETWLKDLMDKEKLDVINGLLAALYLEIDSLDEATKFALLAKQKFPNTDVWESIMGVVLMQKFEEQESDAKQ